MRSLNKMIFSRPSVFSNAFCSVGSESVSDKGNPSSPSPECSEYPSMGIKDIG